MTIEYTLTAEILDDISKEPMVKYDWNEDILTTIYTNKNDALVAQKKLILRMKEHYPTWSFTAPEWNLNCYRCETTSDYNVTCVFNMHHAGGGQFVNGPLDPKDLTIILTMHERERDGYFWVSKSCNYSWGEALPSEEFNFKTRQEAMDYYNTCLVMESWRSYDLLTVGFSTWGEGYDGQEIIAQVDREEEE